MFLEIRLIILGRCVALWVNKVLILESKFYVHRTVNTVHDLLTCRTANCFDCQLCGSSTVPRYCYLDFSCDCVPQHIPALSPILALIGYWQHFTLLWLVVVTYGGLNLRQPISCPTHLFFQTSNVRQPHSRSFADLSFSLPTGKKRQNIQFTLKELKCALEKPSTFTFGEVSSVK